MKPLKNFLIASFVLLFLLSSFHLSHAIEWGEVKSKHFVVHYDQAISETEARKISQKAEKYYRNIGNYIGYSRYSNFWTWDERVKIFIFSDQRTFQKKTGQPSWSLGYAARDKEVFKSRAIVSYYRETDFLDGVLPHEISHLIVRDFFGSNIQVPVWLEEGIAQLYEAHKRELANKLIQFLVGKGSHIPLRSFVKWDGRNETDEGKVKIFYAQSLSIVDFLLSRYGSDAFGKLCRHLRDGESFESALGKTYRNSISSLEALEKKWISYHKK